MKYFYDTMYIEEKERWNRFINKLDFKIHQLEIDCSVLGFPNNWKEMLTFEI